LCTLNIFSILGFHTDESFEEYFVDESFVSESCTGVDKVVTLDTEILVLPMRKLTANESNSDLIPVLPETCPLNLSVPQETVVQKSSHHTELDVCKDMRDQSLTSYLL
jgi:hypothetical protein